MASVREDGTSFEICHAWIEFLCPGLVDFSFCSRMWKNPILLSFFFITSLFASDLKAQERGDLFPFQFYRPGLQDGLHLHSIPTITPDEKGGIWLGTFNGIFHFDGQTTRAYRQNVHPDGYLTGFNVRKAVGRPDGKVWFASEAGISIWDPKTVQIRHLGNRRLQHAFFLAVDKEGNALVENVDTLFWLDVRQQLHRVQNLKEFPHSLTYADARLRDMFPDPAGDGIWVSTMKGMIHLRFRNGKNEFIPEPGISRWAQNREGAWLISKKGIFWWLDKTENRIYKVNPKTGRSYFQLNMPATYKAMGVFDILEDRQGNIWFGGPKRNPVVYHRIRQCFLPLQYQPNQPGGFPSHRIFGLFENKDGGIWMGTDDGLVVCNPMKEWLSVYPIFDPADTSANKNRILCVKAHQNKWWMGCSQGKLVCWDPEKGQKTEYRLTGTETELIRAEPRLPGIYSLHFMGDRILVGTNAGLLFFDLKTRTWKREPKLDVEDWNAMIYTQLPEGDSAIWIKLHMAGIARLNLKNLTWKNYGNFSDEDLVEGQTWGFCNLFQGPGGRLMLDDFDSKRLAVYDPKKDRFVLYRKLDFDRVKTEAYTLYSSPDRAGNIWQVMYPLGLFRLNPQNGKLRQCLPADSSEFRFFKAVHAARDGKVWLADQNVVGYVDPASGRYNTFSVQLGSNENNYDTHFEELPDGDLLLSTYYELAHIKPGLVESSFGALSPFVSEIQVNGMPFPFLKNQLLELEHHQNILSLRLGFLSERAHNLEFEYRFRNETTFHLIQDNLISFFSLAPGQYEIHFRARTKDGHWKSPDQIFRIRIRPAFYQTWWFWTVVILVLSSLVYFFFRTKWDARDRLFALEARALNLEKEKTIVQYEGLKQQLNPHFLFNSLSSLGSLIRIDPKMAAHYLEAMSKSYRYILKSQEQELVPLRDELQFIQTYIQLQKVRFEDALQVEFRIEEECSHLKIVPVTLQNLMENAIKHNIVDQDSPLRIEIFTENGFLCVRNQLQRKEFVETSNKRGLKQLVSLYQYLDSRPVRIEEDEGTFTVSVPLI